MEDVTRSGVILTPLPMADLRKCPNPQRTLIVYQNAKGTGESAVQELLARARIVVPALMNYMFFTSTHTSVLYLGKRVVGGKKFGINEGAVDMKIRMIRYLTTDMWPPLLHTDAPDDSYLADMPHVELGESFLEDTSTGEGEKNTSEAHREISVDFLKQVALERRMEVLVYIKNAEEGMKYLKLILRNAMHRLHFDVIDPRDEKHRWEERKLFVRMLDNLETRKAIPSFETYESAFREACAVTARLPVNHVIMKHVVVIDSSRGKTESDNPNEEHFYSWMAKLSKPEGSMLDYKSYIFDTAEEIKYNAVRFICGFLNAYREGKLLIGVHEVPKRKADGSIPSIGDGKNSIIRHDDLVDQYVVGVHLSTSDLEDIQQNLSKQLLDCVPPVPPQAVHVSVLPVKFPNEFKISKHVLVLWDEELNGHGNSAKQKLFCALHYLVSQGLALVAVESETLREKFANNGQIFYKGQVGFYGVASLQDPSVLVQLEWEESLLGVFEGQKNSCCFEFVPTPADVEISTVSVVEVSVSLKRCSYLPLRMYTGKFFSGWPSIPIWDTVTKTVRRVERNCNIFHSFFSTTFTEPRTAFPKKPSNGMSLVVPTQNYLSSDFTRRRTFQCPVYSWFTDPRVATLVLSYLGDTLDCLRFRLLHPVCDNVFEHRQGLHLIQLLLSASFGNVSLGCSWEAISWMQSEMRRAEIPPIPLLLCRVFESIGVLPSPFPYVAVPLSQQSFRVSKYLVPLFNLQSYFDGQMKPSIVLDMRDGIVKSIRLQDGIFILETVIGVGFGNITRRQLNQFLLRRRMSEEGRLCDDENITSSRMPGFLTPTFLRPQLISGEKEDMPPFFSLPPPLEDNMVQSVPRDVERCLPLLSFKFITEESLGKYSFASFSGSQVNDVMEMERERGDFRRMPWTLPHLLAWFNVLASDDHVQSFGYCRRSIMFHIESLREVCQEHVDNIEEGNSLTHLRFADSPTSCVLHRKMDAWLSL